VRRLLQFLSAPRESGGLGRTLKVGVLIDGQTVPAWVRACLECLSTLPGMQLELFTLGGPDNTPSTTGAGLLWGLYQRSCRRAIDPEATTPLGEVLGSKLAPSLLETNEGGELAQAARSVLRRQGYDVLLSLSSRPLQGDCSGLAQFGAWSLAVDGQQLAGGGCAFFRNAFRRSTTISLSLILHQERFDVGRMIHQYDGAACFGLYSTENMVDPLATTGVIIGLRLLNAQSGGLAALTALDTWGRGDIHLKRSAPPPGDVALLRFVVPKLLRSVRLRLPWNRRNDRWFVAYRPNRDRFTARRDRFCPDGFVDLAVGDDYEAADPFLVSKDGRNFLFWEEMLPPNRFGRIAVVEISQSGAISPPRVALEKPYHLSYPCAFEHEGDYFMVPESSANSTVDLYRATRFPDVWRHEKTLAADVSLVDTTPLFDQGRWYFFTTAVHPRLKGGMHTLLFQSEKLDAPWRPHPVNVICSDVRRARSAGSIFVRNGKLIRPGQDCTIRYGRAIALNEIIELSPERYQERHLETILPTWRQDLTATHTLNSNSELEVIDGLRLLPVFRYPGRPDSQGRRHPTGSEHDIN